MQLEIAFTKKHRFWMKLSLAISTLTVAFSLLAGLGLIIFTLTDEGKVFIVLLGMGIFLILMTLPSIFYLLENIKRYRQNLPFLAYYY